MRDLTTFKTDLKPFDMVMIDDDRSIIGTCIAFCFRPCQPDEGVNVTVQVAYVHNGINNEP